MSAINVDTMVQMADRHYDGELTFTGALKLWKKYNRWKTGKIDWWDERKGVRVPPDPVLKEMFAKVTEALEERAEHEVNTLQGVNLGG